ncbi:2,3-bisphosphoglycerate-independent phosphoglycerate mutase [Thiomicrospira sp. S5]|uniref:2,3-bisphosphoglycerate-independent phosphoglycerate mutase n=1 Tax=Thiomicrospira sp. S5 TaxID=1803865 RepID=UPI000F8A1832|nr:2,3-bisphosphoglycerate-independent phosphoglycerate mutase [Thiomicrospira sp. S5]AZR81237.1 2,3-bisphosphoglycerate-independent phosphoglycerate mutase [Thiomicrospira sp. S5]
MTDKVQIEHRPTGLIILDGWGHREATQHNAIAQASTPNWDNLLKQYHHTLINTSGLAVGLPEGQMGNSEVGHMNLGAGRVVYQELTRIQKDIDDGRFFQNNALLKAIDSAIDRKRKVHILGLLSDGGVHSHINHIKASVQMAHERGADIYVHVFTDGRDTAPKSAIQYIEELEDFMQELGGGQIASVTGRYYALDRDNRWDRVKQTYDVVACGISEHEAKTAKEAVEMAYARGETDEFILATAIPRKEDGKRVRVKDGDSIIFMNFRSDRARQLTKAFIFDDFEDFHRCNTPVLSAFVTLTEYKKNFEKFGALIAYRPTKLRNTFGEYVAKQGLKQLRIAETEKYAHVTFFFNGGVEEPNDGEDRILINSPKVATYDLQPEMSLPEVKAKLIEAIKSGQYDTFICNIANPDMVGHTGNFDACVKAAEAVDEALGEILATLKEAGGEAIVTADHGNMEMLFNEETGKPVTSHTTFPVPLVYVGDKDYPLKTGGALCDVIPTLFDMMGLEKPEEMTGTSLIDKG